VNGTVSAIVRLGRPAEAETIALMTAAAVRAAIVPLPRTVAHGEAQRSFLRMVSHELRTPLNSIIGFSEVLGREIYGPLGAPQYREYAEIINGSGLKLLRMVNQVLEIVRLESGASDLDPRAEALGPAIDEVAASLAKELAARDLRVVVEDREALPIALVDGRALKTILCNLLDNAVAFSPNGGEIRLQARAGFSTVTLEIEDSGEGVDPSDLPRLLRPFEQGENALTRSSDGAGLGLPIVQLLAQAMGGSLTLRSAPGEGFTASVLLLRP